MRAVQFSHFGDPEVLELVELPTPQPGPGQISIRVRAAGINASDWKKRRGLMDSQLPQTLGYEAAGTIKAVGEGVDNVRVGDAVFGFCTDGAAQAEETVMSIYAPLPEGITFAQAAALPAALETAARALDQLGIPASGLNEPKTLLINGASGNVGAAAVQLAVARGTRVIGTARPANHELLRSLGAEPIAYGQGLADRLQALLPQGPDLALDVAGNGILPDMVRWTGDTGRVLTVADVVGAAENGVRFSRGDDGRALYILSQIGELIKAGQFKVPAIQTFKLADVADAHRVGEAGQSTGKLIRIANEDSKEN